MLQTGDLLILLSRLEPLVYEHVSLYTDKDFDRFYRTLCERRSTTNAHNSTFLQRHVRTLFLCPDFPGAERLIDLVQHLTQLRSLACWDGDVIQWGHTAMGAVLDTTVREGGEEDPTIPFPYPHLRRISFCASILSERNISFTHRAFRDLTHMDILVHPTVNWESLQSLDNLTHICLDMATDLPRLTTKEIQFWFNRLLGACPTNVKVVILAIIEDSNADFDLRDSEGDYFYPGWPPPPSSSSSPPNEDPPWLSSKSQDSKSIDLETLHPIAQLAFGIIDSRAVPAAVTSNVSEYQIFKDLIVYFNWPDNRLDWDGTAFDHRDCWLVAEDIIEKRKGLTWGELAKAE